MYRRCVHIQLYIQLYITSTASYTTCMEMETRWRVQTKDKKVFQFVLFQRLHKPYRLTISTFIIFQRISAIDAMIYYDFTKDKGDFLSLVDFFFLKQQKYGHNNHFL